MPLIEGGPPEWIWERVSEALKWEIVTSEQPNGQMLYELRVQCGLEIMRLQFLTAEEVRHLASLLGNMDRDESLILPDEGNAKSTQGMIVLI
jgi:hypothetical protein